jgi:two-component system CheB/CheR fusion protein
MRYALERHRDQVALRAARDELERRVHERTVALARANQALQEADRRKDEFLAMLAHELRNPLAPIRTGLQVLRMPPSHGLSPERIMQMIEHEIHQLTRLVDDLLDVSRITRGKIELRKETVDLATIVSHAVETVRPLINAQKQRLSAHLPDEPIHLEADPTRLEQIFSNLLHNAAKYTEAKGRIELTAERCECDVIVRIRDNGIGISAELLPRLFDIFTQADRSLARSQGGLGIGLTLVRSLVQLHGGSVTARSEGPGKGSEFVVRLQALMPTPNIHVPGMGRSEGAEPASDAPLRILVVDDNEGAAETLVLLLKAWGHDVRCAWDGPAALLATRTFQPDVILLDIGLPGMNGFDVARHIRHEPGKQPFIAAVTGYGQEDDRRQSHEAGFDEHLIKPVSPTTLKQVLVNARSGQQAHVTA